MKWLPLGISISAVLGFGGAATADSWYSPYCPSGSGTLKRNGITVDHVCEKVVTENADCLADYTLKVDGVFKDKCEKVTKTATAVACKLNVGEIADNWKLVVENGPDHCEHKTDSKGEREVKCTGGAALTQDYAGNGDRCVDESDKIVKDATCPAGATHKVAGKDQCEKTTLSPPAFH